MKKRCFVCDELKDKFLYNPLLSSSIQNICSIECYNIYCAEYSMAELNTTLDEMESRLNAYRKEKGGRNSR